MGLRKRSAALGAAAVALWLIGADGSLGLLGEAGLGPAEASRWRWIPPQMDCLEQRVAGGGTRHTPRTAATGAQLRGGDREYLDPGVLKTSVGPHVALIRDDDAGRQR